MKDQSDIPLSTISKFGDLSHSFTVTEPVANSLEYSSIPAFQSQSDSSLTKMAPLADTRTLVSIGIESISHITDTPNDEFTSLANLYLSISTNFKDAVSSIESYWSFTIDSDYISATAYGESNREKDDQSGELTTVSSYKEDFSSRGNNLLGFSTTSRIVSTTTESTMTSNIDNYHERSYARSIESAIEQSLISSYPDNVNGTWSSLLPMSVFQGPIDTQRLTADNHLITSDENSLDDRFN